MKSRWSLMLVALFVVHVPLAWVVDSSRSNADASANADPPAEKQKAPKPDKDGWYKLFDGKTLEGWRINQNPESWRIEDGHIVANGQPSHVFYVGPVSNHRFKNFELELEIMTKPRANSGVYVHTKFQPEGWPSQGLEVQVNNSHSDPRRTASLYRIKDIMNTAPAKDNEWFTMNIAVKDRRIVVKIDGKVVNDFTQPKDFKHESGWEKNVLSEDGGTICLQAHDPESEVHYRSVRIKPLD